MDPFPFPSGDVFRRMDDKRLFVDVAVHDD